MLRFHRLVVVAFFAVIAAGFAAPAQASPTDARAPLSEALEDWVALLEQDDLKVPVQRWARDEQAAKALEQHWARLKQCHQDYNYHTWIDGDAQSRRPSAKQVGDATEFTVGGHEFGHLHVKWVKGDRGWRIADVWMCR